MKKKKKSRGEKTIKSYGSQREPIEKIKITIKTN